MFGYRVDNWKKPRTKSSFGLRKLLQGNIWVLEADAFLWYI
jgi:hypothetical protein